MQIKLPFPIEKGFLEKIPDVKTDSGFLIFGKSWTEEKVENFRQKFILNNAQFEAKSVKAFAPSDSDRSAVKALMKGDIDVDKFGFFEAVAADTKPDFQEEMFTESFLKSLVPQAKKGITILVNHDTSLMVGSTYDATTQPISGDSTNTELIVKFYIPDYKVSKTGGTIKQDFETGVLKYMSVSTSGGAGSFKDVDGKTIYVRDISANRPPVFVELSGVYRGAQPRASIKSIFPELKPLKNMSVKKTFKLAEKSFEFEATTEGALIEPSGFQAELDALTAKSVRVDALEAQVKSFKEPIVNEIGLLQKKLELVEEKAETLHTQSIEALQKSLDALKKMDEKLNPKSQIPENGSVKPTENILSSQF